MIQKFVSAPLLRCERSLLYEYRWLMTFRYLGLSLDPELGEYATYCYLPSAVAGTSIVFTETHCC